MPAPIVLTAIALATKAAPIILALIENKEDITKIAKGVFGLFVKEENGTAVEADYLAVDAELDAELDKFNALKRPVGG